MIQVIINGLEIPIYNEEDTSDIKEVHSAMKRVFSSDDGRMALGYILAKSNFIGGTYTKGDEKHTTYLEGRKSVADSLIRFLEKNPEQLQMKEEKDDSIIS